MKNKYYEDVIARIRIFIHGQQYKQAERLLNKELNLPYIPGDVLPILEKLLVEVNQYINNDKIVKLVNHTTPEEIFQILSKPLRTEESVAQVWLLSQFNITPYMKNIHQLLLSEGVPNSTKTHLCFLLKYNQVKEPVVIMKNSVPLVVDCTSIPEFSYHSAVRNVIKQLDITVSNENVGIYNLSLQLLRLAFDDVYPTLTELSPSNLTAGALIALSNEMHGQVVDMEYIAKTNHLSTADLKTAINRWNYLRNI